MADFGFLNNAVVTLNADIDDAATAIVINEDLPGIDTFHYKYVIAFEEKAGDPVELMLATGWNGGTKTLTVARGQEGTTAIAHSMNDTLAVGIISGASLSRFVTNQVGGGGIDVAGGVLYNNTGFGGNYNLMNWLGSALYKHGGAPPTTATVVDWQSERLISVTFAGSPPFTPTSALSLDWHARKAYKADGTTVVLDYSAAVPAALTANVTTVLATELAALPNTLAVVNALRQRVLDLETILKTYKIAL